ncbi:MAG: VanZ family protein [Gemmatimonadota bacterium]
MTRNPGRSPRIAIVGATLLIALITLIPRSEYTAPRFDWSLTSSPRELLESVLNVVLFMPFGAALYTNRQILLTTATLGFGLSLVVELLQRFVIPGREGELQDLITNTLGAILGWILARALARQPAA